MEPKILCEMISFCFSATISFFQFLSFWILNYQKIFPTLAEKILSLYFLSYGISECTIDLDDQTTINFWVTNRRKFNRPNLVLIHGYGSDSRWQFLGQVRILSEAFNLYMPDLLFFGKSFTNRSDRSDAFQAECVREGLKKLGIEKYNLVGSSYGGFVAYRLAEKYAAEVEKAVVISSGICFEEEAKTEHFGKIGNIFDLLLPNKPEDLRAIIKLSMYKIDHLKWVPDFVLWSFINVLGNNHRKEKLELLEYLFAKKDTNLGILKQETLLIWGDQDKVFPVSLAYQLQRHLGPKSRVEIIKDTGHAVNMESPDAVNGLITSFILGRC